MRARKGVASTFVADRLKGKQSSGVKIGLNRHGIRIAPPKTANIS